MPSPFEKLRIFREGGPRQRWMRWWDLINGKNNNIVGQGLAPAVRCGIKSMKKRANTVRPYGWNFYQCFKIRTPTNASLA